MVHEVDNKSEANSNHILF